ncbi:MAG TPA: ArsC/Spx/MgsR family protein [Atribacterota bacterium]|nr:ArsC/Spx/MgsR family protein [Atribacterota bacterium]
MELSGLINKKSQVFKKLAVTLTEFDDRGIIQLIEGKPRIVIRPILTEGKHILFGFKEQNYLDFIEAGENPLA